MTGRATHLALALAACIGFLPASAHAQITEDNVLLIVNTASVDSLAIRTAYTTKYPGVRVWEYPGPTTSRSITREDFDTELRLPLKAYLESTPEGEPQPLYQTVRVLVTTKGVPTRVHDVDYVYPSYQVGDDASSGGATETEWFNNRYDAASVDSELVVLHHDLRPGDQPEPPGEPKNYANNYIRNPYYGGTSRIDTYSRQYATVAKTLTFFGSYWKNLVGVQTQYKLLSGDIYLVTRLSGYTVEDVTDALDRSGRIGVRKDACTVVLDRTDYWGDETGLLDFGDFKATRNLLTAEGFNTDYDNTSTFLTTASHDVLGYAGYGVNHRNGPPSGRRYVLLDLDPHFTLCDGAIFNTYESWNGRDFECTDPLDVALHDRHGQVADWLRIGGTLGFGHVFEPFASSVADNAILYDRMLLRGWTFAEAAYASLPYLSWQNIVVGDPLATFYELSEVTAWQIAADHDAAGTLTTTITDGYIEPRNLGIRTLLVTVSAEVDPATLGLPGAVTITGDHGGDMSSLIQPLTLDPTGCIMTITLSSPLPNADTYTVTVAPTVKNTQGNAYEGDTSLVLSALAGDVNASGLVTGADMLAVRPLEGQAPTSQTARFDVDRSGAIAAGDILAVRAGAGHGLP